MLAEHAFGFNVRSYDEPIPEKGAANASSEQSISIATTPRPITTVMWAHYQFDEIEQAISAGERALTLNPNDAHLTLDFGVVLCWSGDWARGLRLVEKAMILNPLRPGTHHILLSLDAYRRQDFENAVLIAEKIQLPKLYWTHLVLAIAYAEANKTEKARSSLATLLEMHPGYAADPEAELRKWIKDDPLVEQCLGSLRKARLQ